MAIRQVDLTAVRGYSNDVDTYGNYLIDALNRIIGNIEALKSRSIIEGEAANVLSQIAADAYSQAKEYKRTLENFAIQINKIADETEQLDQEYSKKMHSDSMLKGVQYKNNSYATHNASIDPSSGNVNIETKYNYGPVPNKN